MANVDVAPTLLRLIGVPIPTTMTGSDLFAEDTTSRQRVLFSETEARLGGGADPRVAKMTVRRGQKKLIVTTRGRHCFDLDADPREVAPIPDDQECNGQLSGELDEWMTESRSMAASLGPTAVFPMSQHERERLRALGYLD